MALFLFAFLFAAYASGRSVLAWNRMQRLPASEKSRLPPRPAVGTGSGYLVVYIVLALVTVYVFLEDGWLLAELGVNPRMSIPLAFGLGAVAYAAVAALFWVLIRATGSLDRHADASYLALRALWPRHRDDKLFAFIAICLLNPWVEEVLSRGVLVFALGTRLGNPVMPILLGGTLTLLMHVYQGTRNLGFHALYFAAAVTILYSPLGLAGAIGMHFMGDLIPVVTLKPQMVRWRNRRRRERFEA